MNKDKKIFIFVGPPGSGKGSLSSLCIDRFGWVQVSTGNLCREHISRNTKIGEQIDFAIKSGRLVEDSLIVEMVSEWLEKSFGEEEGVIFDGFPRTVPQASALGVLLDDLPYPFKLRVIKLFLDDDIIINRLTNRYICKGSRCQAIYSALKDSKLAPKNYMICDICGGELIRRTDDTEESIRERLETYHQHEERLLNFYGDNVVLELDVDKPLQEVFENFSRLIGPRTV